ncbi:hypothetical protein V1477_014492 [Vespula maculifrons]|uniref:Secreted protein n=1 Tax=Vespula maculifrons TaxID=7453 RepID=A0ABD2BHL0_VESMC
MFDIGRFQLVLLELFRLLGLLLFVAKQFHQESLQYSGYFDHSHFSNLIKIFCTAFKIPRISPVRTLFTNSFQ